jgi:hypothetical protein
MQMKNTFDRLVRARLIVAGVVPKSSTQANLAEAMVDRLKVAEALNALTDEEVYAAAKRKKSKDAT